MDEEGLNGLLLKRNRRAILEEQCCKCHLGNTYCPVLAVQLEYNYEQCNKGNEKLAEAMNLLINEDGICAMKMALETTSKVNLNAECFKRKLVFGDEEQIAALAVLDR